MSWFILFIAGLFEVVWAIGLKYTEGFTRLWPTVGTLAAMALSVGLLGLAMKTLPVGTASSIAAPMPGCVPQVMVGRISAASICTTRSKLAPTSVCSSRQRATAASKSAPCGASGRPRRSSPPPSRRRPPSGEAGRRP